MKAKERHHLKENEFAVTMARVAHAFAAHRRTALAIVVGVVVIAAAGGGYLYVQRQVDEQANALLGAALAIEQSSIVPAPTVPGATQQAGTYPTEAARGEAAVAAFQKVIDAYPRHDVGHAARYHLASVHLSLGRPADAERLFGEVATQAGASLYGSMAKLGQAQALAAQGKFDESARILTDLSGQRDGALPVDGVLMELARVYRRAGKPQDARAAFKRVVDEFPQSGYAAEARRQLATIG